ncbi:MAG: GNAT family N-acetyltransferase [Nitrosomonas sp.]|nr:GNAT family N-acetyltransferase [Nitrosomonas sp.]
MTTDKFQVSLVQWQDSISSLRAVREAVFILEQRVPEALEWDAYDPVSIHVLAMTVPGGKPVGTARLLSDGHIGRMAVLMEWRGKGIGSAMLRCLIDKARQDGMAEIKLNAQVAAKTFYAGFGFQETGSEFMEAGIPHVKMFLLLSAEVT